MNPNASSISWTIEEQPRQPGNQFYHHNIHAINCTREVLPNGKDLCQDCQGKKQNMFDRMESAVNLWKKDGVHPHTKGNILQQSTTLLQSSLDYHKNESRKKSKTIARRDKAINKLTQSTAINVPMNKDADDIFNDDVEEEDLWIAM